MNKLISVTTWMIGAAFCSALATQDTSKLILGDGHEIKYGAEVIILGGSTLEILAGATVKNYGTIKLEANSSITNSEGNSGTDATIQNIDSTAWTLVVDSLTTNPPSGYASINTPSFHEITRRTDIQKVGKVVCPTINVGQATIAASVQQMHRDESTVTNTTSDAIHTAATTLGTTNNVLVLASENENETAELELDGNALTINAAIGNIANQGATKKHPQALAIKGSTNQLTLNGNNSYFQNKEVTITDQATVAFNNAPISFFPEAVMVISGRSEVTVAGDNVVRSKNITVSGNSTLNLSQLSGFELTGEATTITIGTQDG